MYLVYKLNLIITDNLLTCREKVHRHIIISIQSFGNITLNGFTTKVVPNSEDEGTVLSIIDITPAKLNEIVAKINSARDASTTGDIKIAIFIKTTGTQDNLAILINVI